MFNREYRAAMNNTVAGQGRIFRMRFRALCRETVKVIKQEAGWLLLVLAVALFLFGCSSKLVNAGCFESPRAAAEYHARRAGWDSVAIVDTLYRIEKRNFKP